LADVTLRSLALAWRITRIVRDYYLGCRLHIHGVADSWRDKKWRRSMSKKRFARAARFAREIAEFLVPVLTVIKLIVEIASKAANCNVSKQSNRELRLQISFAR
jgi:hypothetical protein